MLIKISPLVVLIGLSSGFSASAQEQGQASFGSIEPNADYVPPSVPLVLSPPVYKKEVEKSTNEQVRESIENVDNQQPEELTDKRELLEQGRENNKNTGQRSKKKIVERKGKASFKSPQVPLVYKNVNERIESVKTTHSRAKKLSEGMSKFRRAETLRRAKKSSNDRNFIKKEPALRIVDPGRPAMKAIPKDRSGVPSFPLVKKKRVKRGGKVKTVILRATKIPHLDVGVEARISATKFELAEKIPKVEPYKDLKPLASRPLPKVKPIKKLLSQPIIPRKTLRDVRKIHGVMPKAVTVKSVKAIKYNLKVPKKVALKNIDRLSQDEHALLTAMLLFRDKDNCEVVLGLFDSILRSKSKRFTIEAHYHLGYCAGHLKLNEEFYHHLSKVISSEDPYYGPLALKNALKQVPYAQEISLASVIKKTKKSHMHPKDLQDEINYLIAKASSRQERFKEAVGYAAKVKKTSPLYGKAQYLLSVGYYMLGNKIKSLEVQKSLLNWLEASKADEDIRTLVSINLGRMYYQKADYKNARKYFLAVDKNHPLWLQALVELGWTQLSDKDFLGAIGNMYSIHTPYFDVVYKPESYVVRAIGYLNICQYADAYRSIKLLEEQYENWHSRMSQYIKSHSLRKDYYETAKNYLRSKSTATVDGLPHQVIREMARQKPFLNVQVAINQKEDEKHTFDSVPARLRKKYARVSGLKRKALAEKARLAKEVGRLQKVIAKNKKFAQALEKVRYQYVHQRDLVDYYQHLLIAIKRSGSLYPSYKKVAMGRLSKKKDALRVRAEKLLVTRLMEMSSDLKGILDNNDLLKYEVFAGSGLNIRYQAAGGETQESRIPAMVKDIEKNMKWKVKGEIWADEIGHYRSTLKNNCPKE